MAYYEIFKELLQSFGFPILAAVYMAYLNAKQSSQFNETINTLSKQHMEETSKLYDAYRENSVVLAQLSERIGKV